MAGRKYKVCLLGEGRVGKTSIVVRYVRNTFSEGQISTIAASCFDKDVPLPAGGTARVSLWDTAGQERFHALGPLYYRDAAQIANAALAMTSADGALLVYDITDEASFVRVKDWVKELRKITGDSITIALVGNKVDLEKKRAVSAAEALKYASDVGAIHFLTSAKLGTGISEAFAELLQRVVSKSRSSGPAPTLSKPRLAVEEEAPPKSGSGGCCK